MLDIPAAIDELGGQPVQQLRVRRRGALRAEVLHGRDDAPSEDHLPEAVHGHPRRERMRRIRQPAGQAEAVVGQALGERRQRAGQAGLDTVAGGVEGPADQHVRRAHVLALVHHHDRRQRRHVVLAFQAQLAEILPDRRHAGGRCALQIRPAQLAPLGRRPLVGRKPGDLARRFRHGDHGDLAGSERPGIDARVVDQALEAIVRFRTVADARGLVDPGGVQRFVDQHAGGRHAPVDIDAHAIGVARAVVGGCHVGPLSQGNRFFRLDTHPVRDAGSVDAELQLARYEEQAVALRAGDPVARDDPAGARLGPDPCGQRERIVEVVIRDVPEVEVPEPVQASGAAAPAVRGVPGPVERPPRDQAVGVRPILDGCGQAPRAQRLFDTHLATFQFRFARRDPAIEVRELRGLFPRRRMDERRRIAVLVIAPAIRHVIEVRVEPVKLLLRERVVLVVVAPRATERQSQPDRGGSLDAVDGVLDLVLVRIRAVLGIAAMVAIEARGDVLRQRWTGQEVARELLDREPVERHVGVERVDHPVAPAPHVPRAVVLIAVSVRVAGGIQPPEGHAFAKARRGQQAFHGLFVSGWRWVGDEVAHRAGGRRESGEI